MSDDINIHNLESDCAGDYNVPEAVTNEFTDTINRLGIDNHFNMPDFLIGEYLFSCLQNLSVTLLGSDKWHTEGKVR